MIRLAVFLVALALLVLTTSSPAAVRDGRRYDPGASMTQRAEGAPSELDEVGFLLGSWDVAFTVHPDDSTAFEGRGEAEITFMNRGHALMERFHTPATDEAGTDRSTVSFLVFNPPNATWLLGMADSYTEHIALYNGDLRDGNLALTHTERRRGGAVLTTYHIDLVRREHDSFILALKSTTDHGGTWTPHWTRTYTRRSTPGGIQQGKGFGSPAPDRPAEAADFDFLLGEWSFQHDMTFPGGRKASWPATGTAVLCLNGRGLLEFSWYDVDPQLPDAATSIVRLWNRQMRRWESMYMTNRFPSILHFGGVREGEEIVLHQFQAHLGDSPVSYWIFHDIGPDAYSWRADTSRDRGRTFQTTWTIAARRKSGS